MAANIIEITSDNFQGTVLENDKPVLIDFWAEWCGPCRMIAPVIEEIAGAHENIVVGKVDIDAHPDLAQRYGITGIPFFGLFQDGILAKQAVGAMPRAALEQKLGLV